MLSSNTMSSSVRKGLSGSPENAEMSKGQLDNEVHEAITKKNQQVISITISIRLSI